MMPPEDEKHIQIMELFGPTIQGEGIMTGTVTHFLRTGGCPLRCTWCDSMFAVDPHEILKHRQLMTTWEIIDAIVALPWAPYITFTGGDPCIQQRLGDIIPAINAHDGMRVAVETQGMYFPSWLQECDVLTFSPKGPSSGNIVKFKPVADYCMSLGRRRPQRVCIKIVCFDQADFDYAMQCYDHIPETYYDAFYFTAGTPMDKNGSIGRAFGVLDTQILLAEQLLETSKTIRFNDKVHVGCQQHVLLWPDKDKGV